MVVRVPVRRFRDNPSLSYEERFQELLRHHEEETKWLIGEIETLRHDLKVAEAKLRAPTRAVSVVMERGPDHCRVVGVSLDEELALRQCSRFAQDERIHGVREYSYFVQKRKVDDFEENRFTPEETSEF